VARTGAPQAARRSGRGSKALAAADALLGACRQALAQGPDAPLAAERELAASLGISRRTLQQALHILDACGVIRSEQGRGNYPQPEAGWRALPAGGARLLLALAERQRGTYLFDELRAGIAGAAAAAGAELTVIEPAELEARSADRKFLGQFRGLVLIDPPSLFLVAALLDHSARPVVVLEHAIRDLPVVSVCDGAFRGACDAVKALVALGHRRIALLDREDWAVANPAKYAGYHAGLVLAGLDAGRELVRLVPDRDLEPAVARQMAELMALAEPPTAVICVREAPAMVVLDWMGRSGLVPGRDLSVIGSGDGAYRQRRFRKLSSIRVHFRRMGELAALEALCAERSAQMRTIIVLNRLKLRDTVGPPRAPFG